jgi:hypothetical protein
MSLISSIVALQAIDFDPSALPEGFAAMCICAVSDLMSVL